MSAPTQIDPTQQAEDYPHHWARIGWGMGIAVHGLVVSLGPTAGES